MKKINKDIEEIIFQRAMEAFKTNFAGQIEIETLACEPVDKIGYQPDRLIRIMIHGKILEYCAEIRTVITKANKLTLLMKRENPGYALLLIVKHVNPQMAEYLRQAGIEFIDMGGNAFINKPPTYIFIKGNKPLDIIEQTSFRRRLKPAGQKIIFAFLCNPDLEKKPYRNIAADSEVALGTVGWIMKELKELGILIDMGKRGCKLIQKEKLFHQWAAAYPEQLRKKQYLGRFRGEDGWWQEKKLDPLKAQWGGEVAAARLTNYMKPELITLYTTAADLNQILLENRLKRDMTGDVEILARFWKPVGKWEFNDLVHPILIYADLLAAENPRNTETARMIYEKYIVRFIRED